MKKNYDVIIAGSGIAGLYAAINLPESFNILIISKRDLILCNSALAQGGIAGVYNAENDNDDIQFHHNDSLIAGGFKNNPLSLSLLVSQASVNIGKIIELGVNFDKNLDGSLHKTLEGGHSRHRIFHHKDSTGHEIVSKLLEHTASLKNVDILDYAMLCGIKKTSTGFSALILRNNEFLSFNSHYFILATGGIGRIYEYTTNSAVATGDGIAFAYELGAQIKNLSYIQFHPTAFNNKKTRECFLISEAVRGEGAYLLNCAGERFMRNYDNRLELAPRDVVSRAVIMESERLQSTDFYLDISHKNPEYLKNRFPQIYGKLLQQGFDLTKDKIPIYPCQHYLMGGINVDINAKTNINGLYAIGECSHTGVHGINRLASNSLLEALVFARLAALNIDALSKSYPHYDEYEDYDFPILQDAEPIPQGIRTEVRHIMQKSFFVIPDKKEAAAGYRRVLGILKMFNKNNYKINSDYVEAKSLTTIACLILKEVINSE